MVISINKKIIFLILLILLGLGIFSGFYFSLKKNPENQLVREKIKITLYKDPNCDCCQDYVAYLKENGFEVETVNTQEMIDIKEKYQISPGLEACHTAIIDNYFIEGHVPIEGINKLLKEKPDILGIGLAGMPSGSPGMGGIKKGEFKIYSLSKDGQTSEFMSL